MKRVVVFFYAVLLALTLAGASVAGLEDHEKTWKGEIIDLMCYVSQGAKGPDHAGCAKACVKNGQPMGLLTDDGTLVLLVADHRNGEPYEKLKDVAGERAEVTGELAERDGMKVVSVTGSKAGD